ncbi:hypothetical protein AHiyo6_33040, partial [Arthrobacter sp. Hiyo6]
ITSSGVRRLRGTVGMGMETAEVVIVQCYRLGRHGQGSEARQGGGP